MNRQPDYYAARAALTDAHILELKACALELDDKSSHAVASRCDSAVYSPPEDPMEHRLWVAKAIVLGYKGSPEEAKHPVTRAAWGLTDFAYLGLRERMQTAHGVDVQQVREIIDDLISGKNTGFDRDIEGVVLAALRIVADDAWLRYQLGTMGGAR